MAKNKALANTLPTSPDKDSPKRDQGDEHDYEADSALRALEDAEKHKANPAMMARVKKLAGRKVKALTSITSIADLNKVYDDKFGKGALKK